MFRLIPSVKFSVGKQKLKPYLRAGLVIGLAPKIVNKGTYTNTYFSTYSEYTTTFSGGTSVGYSAGLGANYKLSKRLSLFAEVALISQAWAPKKSVVNKSLQNGVDQMPSLTTRQRETVYVSSYEDSAVDSSLPAKALKTYMPFSSIGINIGARFSIGKLMELQ